MNNKQEIINFELSGGFLIDCGDGVLLHCEGLAELRDARYHGDAVEFSDYMLRLEEAGYDERNF